MNATPGTFAETDRKPVLLLVVVGLLILTSSLAVLGIGVVLLNGRSAASHDFIEYWAASRQLLHGANPYDAKAIFEIEKSAGFSSHNPVLIMRNPPSMLALVLPVGLVGARLGSILWSLLLIGCLAISIRLLWIMYGQRGSLLHLAGLCFAPALACLATGQSAIFCLFGLVLFLYFHRTLPLAAGMALWFCALKPQIFLPFAAVLLVWALWRRAYMILLGAALSLAAATALSMCLDSAIWTQYAQMMHSVRIDQESMPIFSQLLRTTIDSHALWLQALPAIAGSIWALGFAWVHRGDWDWRTHGALLMLVSVLVAPYSFFFDQIVLLPAIFDRLFVAQQNSLLILATINMAMLAEILLGTPMRSPLYLWTSIAWLLWYLSCKRIGTASAVEG